MELAAVLYSLLVTGAGLAASSAVGEFAKGAGKSAFDALKARLTGTHNANSLALLDQAKNNPNFEAAIKSDLARADIIADPEVRRLAAELRTAIEVLPATATAPYAIDIGVIESGRDLLFEDVEGVRSDRATSVGDMTFRGVRSPGGKS